MISFLSNLKVNSAWLGTRTALGLSECAALPSCFLALRGGQAACVHV